MCPVCTLTVVAGLGISRFLGIDDVVTSIWIGAFILSFTFITIDWVNKKWPKLNVISYMSYVILVMYLLVLVPLKLNGSIGIPKNTLWGMDKIVLGIAIGSIVFLIGIWADRKQRRVYKKQFFNFQKVVFPVLGLIIASVIFWLITNL